MAAIESSVVIARPVEEVFAFVTDFANGPAWQETLDEVEMTSPGATRLGTSGRETRTVMNQRVESTFSVIEWTPNVRYVLRTASPGATIRAEYAFDAVGGNTRLTVSMEPALRGFLKMMEQAIVNTAQRHLDADLASLKSLLERDG